MLWHFAVAISTKYVLSPLPWSLLSVKYCPDWKLPLKIVSKKKNTNFDHKEYSQQVVFLLGLGPRTLGPGQ